MKITVLGKKTLIHDIKLFEIPTGVLLVVEEATVMHLSSKHDFIHKRDLSTRKVVFIDAHLHPDEGTPPHYRLILEADNDKEQQLLDDPRVYAYVPKGVGSEVIRPQHVKHFMILTAKSIEDIFQNVPYSTVSNITPQS